MDFFIDNNKKIIFGTSAKAGCSHVKNLIAFCVKNFSSKQIIELEEGEIHQLVEVHSFLSNSVLEDLDSYDLLTITRNPYDRLLSGFLDKYPRLYRPLWPKSKPLTFNLFIDQLITKKWKTIEKVHFQPQCNNLIFFDKHFYKNRKNLKKLKDKKIKVFDIKNIDYSYLENIYEKSIPLDVINKKQGHERKEKRLRKIAKVNPDMEIDEYFLHSINKKDLLTPETKENIYNFYIDDFRKFNYNK